MPSEKNPLRDIAPYVVPFLAYVVPTSFESSGVVGLSYESIYTLKALLSAVLLWTFRRSYPPFSTAGFRLAVLAGLVGVVVWIVLAHVQTLIPGFTALVEKILGSRAGFDPFAADGSAARRIAFIALRLTGLAVIVPLMEEIFWRGFLARYLIDEDFRNVPQGKFTRFTFAAVTVAFATVHPELLAALAWGALVNEVYRRTANLWACVVMHAVTNALLGAYVLATGNWQLW